MSNELVVTLGLVASVLGGGCATWVLALLRQNQYLEDEVQSIGTEYNNLSSAHRRLEVESKNWNSKAYEQNQKFLLACGYLSADQIAQIEKDIKSL